MSGAALISDCSLSLVKVFPAKKTLHGRVKVPLVGSFHFVFLVFLVSVALLSFLHLELKLIFNIQLFWDENKHTTLSSEERL